MNKECALAHQNLLEKKNAFKYCHIFIKHEELIGMNKWLGNIILLERVVGLSITLDKIMRGEMTIFVLLN